MRYYSDELNKVFDTEEELNKAENAERARIRKEKMEKEKKANERKEQADKVKAAYEVYLEARSKYAEALEDFTRKFGPYHQTYTGEEPKPGAWSDRA